MNPDSKIPGSKQTELEQILARIEMICKHSSNTRCDLGVMYEKLSWPLPPEGCNDERPSRMGVIGSIFDLLDRIDEEQGRQGSTIKLLSNII